MAAEDGPLSDLTPEEQEILADLARAGAEGRVDRRALLKLGAAAGIGAILTGAAADPAAADASASDGDGDIGSPSNRVDAILDGIDAASIEGAVAGGNTITDLVGQGLAVASGTVVTDPDIRVSDTEPSGDWDAWIQPP